jgi:hypothetical protein
VARRVAEWGQDQISNLEEDAWQLRKAHLDDESSVHYTELESL